MDLKWSQNNSIRMVFTCFVCVCVDDVVSLRGCKFFKLERVQIFILAE